MKKKILLCVLAVLMALPLVAAAPRDRLATESFVYNRVFDGYYPVPAPMPYRYVASFNAQDVGVDSFLHLQEIEYHNGQFFITNGNTLVITDNNLQAHTILTGLYIDGAWSNFGVLDGIFITPQGEIYVAEPGVGHAQGRVYHLDADLNLVRVINRPEGMPGDVETMFRPQKVAVDHHGRIYIIAAGVFEGIIELNPDATFNRFFGIVEVRLGAMEMLRRAVSTPQQRQQQRLNLPINFTNLTIDSTGFVYATLAAAAPSDRVKKLNARGVNIIRRTRDAQWVGDMRENTFGIGIPAGSSVINMVQVTDFGVYYVFDSLRNRIFAYDQDGHMLFAFGGRGEREGQLSAVNGFTLASDGRLVFADRGNRSIEVFERTLYGNMVINASYYQFRNDYMRSAYYWRHVIRLNPFFQYAYLGVGIAEYRSGNFETAMFYFQQGQNSDFYSMAYQQVRATNMYENFNTVVLTIIGMIVLYALYKVARRRMRARRQQRSVPA